MATLSSIVSETDFLADPINAELSTLSPRDVHIINTIHVSVSDIGHKMGWQAIQIGKKIGLSLRAVWTLTYEINQTQKNAKGSRTRKLNQSVRCGHSVRDWGTPLSEILDPPLRFVRNTEKMQHYDLLDRPGGSTSVFIRSHYKITFSRITSSNNYENTNNAFLIRPQSQFHNEIVSDQKYRCNRLGNHFAKIKWIVTIRKFVGRVRPTSSIIIISKTKLQLIHVNRS